MITLFILLCIFIIITAFQVVGMIILGVAALAFFILSLVLKKLSVWVEHKRFKRTLDKL